MTVLLRSSGLEGVGGAGGLAAARGSSDDSGRSPARDLAAAAATVKLEHGKGYLPYLLFKKKNYAGIKHTPARPQRATWCSRKRWTSRASIPCGGTALDLGTLLF